MMVTGDDADSLLDLRLSAVSNDAIAEEIVASTVDLTQLKALQGRTISHEAMETTSIPGPLLAHRPQC